MLNDIQYNSSYKFWCLWLNTELYGYIRQNGWETLLVHYKSTGMCQNSNNLFIVKDKALNSKILNDCTMLFVDRGFSEDVYSLIWKKVKAKLVHFSS